MSADINIPHVGSVPKPVAFGVVGVAVAFVGYRYYQARTGAASADTATTADSDFDTSNTDPSSVLGAVSSDNGYGLTEGDSGSTDVEGTGIPTTNSQWTQMAAAQLEQDETWSYSAIVTALGLYLSNSAVTADQANIIQAAIAVEGYPPVGTHTIVSGGTTTTPVGTTTGTTTTPTTGTSTKPTKAPTGLKAVLTTKSTTTLKFNPVAGAAFYRAFGGFGANIGSAVAPEIKLVNLEAGTEYHLYVCACSSGGVDGPMSSKVTVHTPKK